jgi:hypothetical protein
MVDLPEDAREFFREQGSVGGKIGGPARAEKLKPAERKKIASDAAKARWAKAKKSPAKKAAGKKTK